MADRAIVQTANGFPSSGMRAPPSFVWISSLLMIMGLGVVAGRQMLSYVFPKRSISLFRLSSILPRRRTSRALAHRAASPPSSMPVLVITGVTGVGKSMVALDLCQRVEGEIISADSVQVYRKMDIGSSKPSKTDQEAVRHHLIDILDIHEQCASGDFVRHACEAIRDIQSRRKQPVVVGGTMMYVQWLIHGIPSAPRSNAQVKDEVSQLLAPYKTDDDWEGALELLAVRSPSRADALTRNDWYRLSRSLEIVLCPPPSLESDLSSSSIFNTDRHSLPFDFRPVFLSTDRWDHARHLDARCEKMVIAGLLSETAHLLIDLHRHRSSSTTSAISTTSEALKAIGYRQACAYLTRDDVSRDDRGSFFSFLEDFMTATRNYASQQWKWYRKDLDVLWVYRSHDMNPSDITDLLLAYLNTDRDTFETHLRHPSQTELRDRDRQIAKTMKRYRPEIIYLHDEQTLRTVLHDADEATMKVQASLQSY